MDKLHKQVAIARRRLVMGQFFAALVWCWFAALMVFAVAIVAQRIWLPEVDGQRWAAMWLAGMLGAGLLAAGVWTWFIRRRDLDAAIEIDHRFGLKERVSSALALEPDELETPFGQALLADTLRRVGRIDVGGRFPVAIGRNSWLPLVPAVVATALFFFFNPAPSNEAGATPNVAAIQKQIKESTEPLRKKIEQQRKDKEKDKSNAEMTKLLERLEDGMREVNKNEGNRNQALSKLNDLAKQLEERQEKLGMSEKLKQQLAQMKNMPNGPADKMAQAMKNGDFKKAIDELGKLKDQLAEGKLDPEKQKELAKQMEAMKEAMQKMAQAQQQAQKQLQEQIERAKQAGDKDAAKQLQEQLDKLAAQKPQMDMLKELANKLGQCAECMKAGEGDKAQAALGEMGQQMAQMQQEMQDMQMVQDLLDELQAAKDAMNCAECQGAGCEACQQGGGNQPNQNAGQGGLEAGRGQGGHGPRPHDPTETKTYDSQVRQMVGKGSSVVTGLVDGPNIKGQVLEDVKSEVEAAKKAAADPLTGQRLPRRQRDHVQQYFDSFREGK